MTPPARSRSFGRVARGASVKRHAGAGQEAGFLEWPLRVQIDRLPATMVTPVALPPGRLRLATSPAATGSIPVVKTTRVPKLNPFLAQSRGVVLEPDQHGGQSCARRQLFGCYLMGVRYDPPGRVQYAISNFRPPCRKTARLA